MTSINGLRVFVSHAADEGGLATQVAELFDHVSLGAIETWRSSGEDGIRAGDTPWVKIHEELGASSRVIVLLTRFSCARAWLTYESGFMAGFLAAERGRTVIPLLFDVERDDIPDPLRSYQCYTASSAESLSRLLAGCLRDSGLKPNDQLISEAVERFIGAFGDYLAPSLEDAGPSGVVVDRFSFPTVLAEKLRDETVKHVELLTYTAEVDAGLVDRYHVRGTKRVDVYKRSILADLADQQAINLQRLALGLRCRPWSKHVASVDASERLERNSSDSLTVRQILYTGEPTRRAYVFDGEEALVAFYEVPHEDLDFDGSRFKGVTNGPALHISSTADDGRFHMQEVRSMLRQLERGARSWAEERAVLQEGAPCPMTHAPFCIRPKAVLFDLDGVLYDSMPQYVAAWSDVFSSYGVDISDREPYEHESRPSRDAIEIIMRSHGKPADRDTVEAMRTKIHDRLAEMGPPSPMPGAEALVSAVVQSGIEPYVVTGSSRPEILDWVTTDFPGVFDSSRLVAPSDKAPGKPSPVPYLTALSLSGLRCCDAIAIENGPLGIQSAAGAGLLTLGINSGPLKDSELLDSGAAVVFKSCDDLAGLWSAVLETLTVE